MPQPITHLTFHERAQLTACPTVWCSIVQPTQSSSNTVLLKHLQSGRFLTAQIPMSTRQTRHSQRLLMDDLWHHHHGHYRDANTHYTVVGYSTSGWQDVCVGVPGTTLCASKCGST